MLGHPGLASAPPRSKLSSTRKHYRWGEKKEERRLEGEERERGRKYSCHEGGVGFGGG